MLPTPVLSDREILCLRWIAAGKTMSDIAQLSGLTYRTVRWDLDNVRAKLNVKNIKQALVLALELGML
jgi:DNA-binding CsgD family transcriptional regulator